MLEESVREREGFTDAQKELMLLQLEKDFELQVIVMKCLLLHIPIYRSFYDAFIIVVMSFASVVRDISDPGLGKKYLLSAKFNQDPLENFFGRVRQSGGWSNHPSSKTVQEATDVIRLQISSMMDKVRSSSKPKKGYLEKQVQ